MSQMNPKRFLHNTKLHSLSSIKINCRPLPLMIVRILYQPGCKWRISQSFVHKFDSWQTIQKLFVNIFLGNLPFPNFYRKNDFTEQTISLNKRSVEKKWRNLRKINDDSANERIQNVIQRYRTMEEWIKKNDERTHL